MARSGFVKNGALRIFPGRPVLEALVPVAVPKNPMLQCVQCSQMTMEREQTQTGTKTEVRYRCECGYEHASEY